MPGSRSACRTGAGDEPDPPAEAEPVPPPGDAPTVRVVVASAAEWPLPPVHALASATEATAARTRAGRVRRDDVMPAVLPRSRAGAPSYAAPPAAVAARRQYSGGRGAGSPRSRS